MTLVAELVIFDCDGVLVDSETISNRVLAAMLTEQGLPTTLPQARREYQGLLLADVLTRAEAKLGRSLAGPLGMAAMGGLVWVLARLPGRSAARLASLSSRATCMPMGQPAAEAHEHGQDASTDEPAHV